MTHAQINRHPGTRFDVADFCPRGERDRREDHADGDGDEDLFAATSNSYPGTILYQNDGHGVFAATDPGDPAHHPAVVAIDVLDADRDGDTDLAMASSGGYGGSPDALYLNDGHGTFHHVASLLDLRRDTYDIGAFDADADGDQDIVSIGWSHGNVLLYESEACGEPDRTATPTATAMPTVASPIMRRSE